MENRWKIMDFHDFQWFLGTFRVRAYTRSLQTAVRPTSPAGPLSAVASSSYVTTRRLLPRRCEKPRHLAAKFIRSTECHVACLMRYGGSPCRRSAFLEVKRKTADASTFPDVKQLMDATTEVHGRAKDPRLWGSACQAMERGANRRPPDNVSQSGE